MEQFAFLDSTVKPDEKLIRSTLGEANIFWKEIMEYARETYPGVAEEWRYYNDGKCWLFKLLLKKKTVAWIGVMKDTFKCTVYLGAKAAPAVASSDLPTKIKEQYAAQDASSHFRSISISVKRPADVKAVKKLINLKIRLK